MHNQSFDVCVIGGGINGAGIAYDAARRGLSVGLFEQYDFGFGASSATSKLAHGGLRYLEQWQFHLVKESLNERNFLLKHASHLVKPLQFFVPLYKDSKWKPWKLSLGLCLYDWMQTDRTLPKHRMITRHELQANVPWLNTDNLVGCGSYYDAQMDDHRLIIELLLMAKDCGARIHNYTKVQNIERTGSGLSIDIETRTKRQSSLTAQSAILATGAWSNAFSKGPIVKPTKGVHIVLPDMDLNAALLLLSPQDERVVFMIPWRGKTLVGTTDQPDDQAYDTPQLHASEAQYLLDCVNAYYKKRRWQIADVESFFCGYRPLIHTNEMESSKQTREDAYTWVDTDILSVIGGKYTTYRKMADRAVQELHQHCFKHRNLFPFGLDYPFIGHMTPHEWPSESELNKLAEKYHIERETLVHLLITYGGLYKDILTTISNQMETAVRFDLAWPMIIAELKYAMDKEWVTSVDDFLFRRTYYGYLFQNNPDMLRAFLMAFNLLKGTKDRPVDAASLMQVIQHEPT